MRFKKILKKIWSIIIKMVMTLMSNPKGTVATVIVALDGTGDTTDIQTGINLLPATGGCVYIKEGNYVLTASITINIDGISLVGCGYSTHINTIGNFPLINVPGPGENITIEKLRLTGNDIGANQYGIYIEDFNRVFMSSLWIEDTGADGIRIISSTFATLFAININDCEGNGISFITSHNNFINAVVSRVCGGNGLYIEDCERCQTHESSYEENDLYGIRITAPTGNAFHNILIGNYVSGNPTGDIFIEADVVKTVILGNVYDEFTDNGTNTQLGHNLETTY